jgi:hypothetical protein
MWSWSERVVTWKERSAICDGNLGSDRPTWIVSGLFGRRRLELAQGPLDTRQVGEGIARALNAMDASQWDWWLENVLPIIMRGEWG